MGSTSQMQPTYLQTAISQAPMILWMLDQTGVFTLSEGKGLEVLGLQPGEVIGLAASDLYNHPPIPLDNIALVLAGNEVNWLAAVGERIYENRAAPLRDAMGAVIGIVGVSTDITQRDEPDLIQQKINVELERKVQERTAALKESNDQLVVEIVQHSQAEKALQYRVAFEELIATLSTYFINLAFEEIDSGINRALEWIAKFSRVDRSYVFLLDATGTCLNNTHEWCAPGIERQIHQRQNIPIAALYWWQEQIQLLDTLYIPSVAKLPKEERIAKAMLRSQSIQSLVVVPMVLQDTLIGFLGFDSVQVEKNWSEDIIALLRIMGEMLVNALERKRVETERKRSEDALQEAKDQLQAVLDAVPGFVSWVSADLRYLGVNQHLAAFLNLSPDVFIGQEVSFLNPDFAEFTHQFFADSIQQASQEIDIKVNNTLRNYLLVAQKYHQSNAAVLVGIDISDRKQAEALQTQLIFSLQESEQKFRSLYEATGDAVLLLDERGCFDCNRAALELFHFQAKEELFGKHLSDFSPAEQPTGQDSVSLAQKYIDAAMTTGSCRFDWLYQRLDGSEFAAEVLLTAMELGSVIPDTPSSGIKVLQAVVRDITQRKQDEAHIKASLAEKEVLLKEIHHRVKNNLQVISSLLRLQSRYIQDEQVLEMLKESQNRVRSMALVHEHLYQSKDLSKIDFAEYIQNLVSHLFLAYQVDTSLVALKTNITSVTLSIDTAVPCGLIINELVSNSLKYAFSREKIKGEIQIEFAYDINHQFLLKISDNGVGFPQNLDFKNAGSLGLRLVCSLVKQLGGSIELETSNGTVFEIRFSELHKLRG